MKKQIINPYIRFGPKAQGRYAQNLGGGAYGRAINANNRLNPELIVNGDFAQQGLGWTEGPTAIVTYQPTYAQVENGTAAPAYLGQTIETEAGVVYTIIAETLDFLDGTAKINVDRDNFGFTGDILEIIASPNSAYEQDFTAVGTTTYISLFSNSGTLGRWHQYNLISVKKK